MPRFVSVTFSAALIATMTVTCVHGEEAASGVFQFKEKTTLGTIQLQSIDDESLAGTVIEGGLAAPAEGIPVSPGAEDDDYYLDPLAIAPRDDRTDEERTEFLPGELLSGSDPASAALLPLPLLQLPTNRTYETFEARITPR